MDEKWEPYWHVFLGKSFGCHSVHERNRFVYFTFEPSKISFLIYKASWRARPLRARSLVYSPLSGTSIHISLWNLVSESIFLNQVSSRAFYHIFRLEEQDLDSCVLASDNWSENAENLSSLQSRDPWLKDLLCEEIERDALVQRLLGGGQSSAIRLIHK